MTEYFKIAMKNVGRRRKRAFLTMLGVFIGIAAVVALVSLGQGLQTSINEQFEKVGADKIIIQAANTGFVASDLPGALTNDDLDVIERSTGVENAAGLLYQAAQVEFNDMARSINIVGLPDDKEDADLAFQVMTFEVDKGRMISYDEGGKTVLGYGLANGKKFGENPQIGDKFLIGGEKYKIVGTLQKTGDPVMDVSMVLSEARAREALDNENEWSMIVAKVSPGSDPEVVAERIKKDMRNFRGVDDGKENFDVQTSSDLIEAFNNIFLVLQAVFVGIAAISLIVGGIGIMNTMYTAVLERTREIGVMKAIGARNSDVLYLFVFESGLLGLAGGFVGVVIGIGLSKLVEVGANAAYGPNTLTAIFPPYLVVGALAFSFLVGTASGVLPARRASRLSPVEALRYE